MWSQVPGWIGAVSGLTSLLWQVRNWKIDRVDLRVEAMVANVIDPSATPVRRPDIREHYPTQPTERPCLCVSLSNHGRRDVHVQSIGITGSRGLPNAVFGKGVEGLPSALKEGERKSFVLNLRPITDPRVVALWAVDGRGKELRLPKRRLQKVLSQALEVLEEERREVNWRAIEQRELARESKNP